MADHFSRRAKQYSVAEAKAHFSEVRALPLWGSVTHILYNIAIATTAIIAL